MEKVIFSDDIIKILNEIMERNGITETPLQAHEKIAKGEDPIVSILAGLSRDIYSGKITESDSIIFLTKKIPTSEDTSKKIIATIKDSVIPSMKTISETPSENNIPNTKNKNIKYPLTERPKKKNTDSKDKITVNKTISDVPMQKTRKKDTDIYREPIS